VIGISGTEREPEIGFVRAWEVVVCAVGISKKIRYCRFISTRTSERITGWDVGSSVFKVRKMLPTIYR